MNEVKQLVETFQRFITKEMKKIIGSLFKLVESLEPKDLLSSKD